MRKIEEILKSIESNPKKKEQLDIFKREMEENGLDFDSFYNAIRKQQSNKKSNTGEY